MTELYWHIHHDVLCEPMTYPVEDRIAFIKANKPSSEVETRLRLMQPVRGKLPPRFAKACAARAAARSAARSAAWASAAWSAARSARSAARDAYDKALNVSRPALERLHRKECPGCPWNGHTIFPKLKK